MPRWNEEEALKLFTALEWEHLAQLAHDLGWDAEIALEDTLDEEAEVPVDQDSVFPRGREKLARLVLLAPFQHERQVEHVFLHNFWLGWRCAESGGYTHEEPEHPGPDHSA